MAAWRFLDNPRVSLPALAQPLLQAACSLAAVHCSHFALTVLDWSWLNYCRHTSKADRMKGPYGVVGYKLLSALLLSDQDGLPLTPLCVQVQTARGLENFVGGFCLGLAREPYALAIEASS